VLDTMLAAVSPRLIHAPLLVQLLQELALRADVARFTRVWRMRDGVRLSMTDLQLLAEGAMVSGDTTATVAPRQQGCRPFRPDDLAATAILGTILAEIGDEVPLAFSRLGPGCTA
jgi:hypothetical protein